MNAWGTRHGTAQSQYNEANGPHRPFVWRARTHAPSVEDQLIEVEEYATALRAFLTAKPFEVYLLYLRFWGDLTMTQAGCYLDDFTSEIGQALRVGFEIVFEDWKRTICAVYDPTDKELEHWATIVPSVWGVEGDWRPRLEQSDRVRRKAQRSMSKSQRERSNLYGLLAARGQATTAHRKLSREALLALLNPEEV